MYRVGLLRLLPVRHLRPVSIDDGLCIQPRQRLQVRALRLWESLSQAIDIGHRVCFTVYIQVSFAIGRPDRVEQYLRW